MEDRKPILVTAAAGQTGGHTVRQLLEKGLPVRALVHRRDKRADELASLGAEVVVGDFHDLGSLREAMAGVKRASFVHPWVDLLLEATTNFALIAREEGLEVTVNMSHMVVREGHASPATRQHWLGEHVLNWAGVGATHIRAGLFAENLLELAAPTVAAEGKIYLPWGQGRHAPVAVEDVASVIVGILTDPELRHVGKAYVVTGGTEMSVADIAETIGQAVGKSVEYVEIPTETWLEGLATAPFMNPHFLKHLERVAEEHRNGRFAGVTEVVESIGGHKPKSLETFVRENIEAFGGIAVPSAP